MAPSGIAATSEGATVREPPHQDDDQGAENQYGVRYRDYSLLSVQAVRPCVLEAYKLNHQHQTYDFVRQQQARWSKFDTAQMGVWEALELLNTVVDDSDPDTSLPQLQHLLQTAEAARASHPEHDWFHLAGLIHDLGKVLAHPRWGSQPQWAVVGDTFPVGCKHDAAVVYHPFFSANPDASDARYNSRCGVYQEGCGLADVMMSFGHDEYLWMVLQHNRCALPPQALFIIRYHSFYALHQGGAYTHLLNDADKDMLPWLRAFQACDLYSKTANEVDVDAVKPYYQHLINKYFPKQILCW